MGRFSICRFSSAKEIQEDILTEQEMMQFAVYMREKREKSSLH